VSLLPLTLGDATYSRRSAAVFRVSLYHSLDYNVISGSRERVRAGAADVFASAGAGIVVSGSGEGLPRRPSGAGTREAGRATSFLHQLWFRDERTAGAHASALEPSCAGAGAGAVAQRGKKEGKNAPGLCAGTWRGASTRRRWIFFSRQGYELL